ncbi:hypothetical protein ACFSX5_13680 [Devosia albogilva]|uniref:Curlin n=1 Tax=Devosia albogilva TaxID=429726 RepID=A0ABW5QM84_9HYPH
MIRSFRRIVSGLFAISIAAPALAQNVGNEVWIGQLGSGNTLDVVQEGRANSAGADNVYLLLGQWGVGNVLTLSQYGYANKVGTLFADEAAYARGIWQQGDINRLSINQHNTQDGGSNIVGAVQQLSVANILEGSANELDVTQTEADGLDGTAGHFIGRIVQWNTIGTGGNNRAVIIQTKGGTGRGNTLAGLYQQGGENQFSLEQIGQSNLFGEASDRGGAWQYGSGNAASVVQDGEFHRLEYIEQRGDNNAARLRLSGDGNAIAHVDQNSEGYGADGNKLEVAISGTANGSSGSGQVGEFLTLAALGQTGVLQGSLRQYGGANNVRLTITAGVESKFGLSQTGDAHQAFITIAHSVPQQQAFGNESAVFQTGSLNYARHDMLGDSNAGAILESGKRNVVVLKQTGDGNIASADVNGDDNNHDQSLFGAALDIAGLVVGLQPGTLSQTGADNAAALVIGGSSNGFTTSQSGTSHLISATMIGSGNAVAVVQQSSSNQSISVQTGSGNALGISQF